MEVKADLLQMREATHGSQGRPATNAGSRGTLHGSVLKEKRSKTRCIQTSSSYRKRKEK